MKDTIKINKKDFLDWRFSNTEDLAYLGELALKMLNGGEVVNIANVWEETGYLPATLVISGLNTPGIVEITPEDYLVEWL